MGEVVTLARKPDPTLVWVCHCACTVHYHRDNGDVECSACGNIASAASDGEWRRKLPDPAPEPPDLDGANFKTIDLTDAAAFLRRQLKASPESSSAIVIIGEDGGLSTWGAASIDTTERADWLRDRLSAAAERLRPPQRA